MSYISMLNGIIRLAHYLFEDHSKPEKSDAKKEKKQRKKSSSSGRAIDEVFAKETPLTLVERLLKKYNLTSESDLFIILATKKDNREVLTEEELECFNLPQFEDDRLMLEFATTRAYESLSGQKMAINDLLNNRYVILQHESGNPLKELLNPILRMYYEAYQRTPEDVLLSLKTHFPKSGNYILEFIQKKKPTTRFRTVRDPIVLYNEFYNFNISYLLSHYPEKRRRDIAVRQNFNYMASNMIHLLDEAESHQIPYLS
jgi:hypothetical protein